MVATAKIPPPPPPIRVAPPPPPQNATQKYLIEPNNKLSKLGIQFQPIANNVGARIQVIEDYGHTIRWKKTYNMQIGDNLYKINGKLVKNMEFQKVMELVESCSSLMFEKEQKIQKKMTAPPVIDNKGKSSLSPMKLDSKVTSKIHSIFSPENKQQLNASLNGEYTMEYMREVQTDTKPCPELVSIPEGFIDSIASDSSLGMMSQRDADVHYGEQQGLNSTFSYSVTTVHEESECPMSPFGTDIQVESAKTQRYPDVRVQELKEKYQMTYFSPESEALSKPRGSRLMEQTMGDTSHYLPIQQLGHHDPSMESCSVSTVQFTSPTFKNQNQKSNTNTPLTNNSAQSAFSYKDIPVFMLNYKYVSECESKKEIKNIITALRSSTEFPSLLKMAEKRLATLKTKSMNKRSSKKKQALEVCYEEDIAENDSQEGIQLENGIPSHIHVNLQEESALFGDDFITTQVVEEEEEENDDMVDDMNDIVMAHAELQDQMESLVQERDAMQESLTSQVQTLQELLDNVNVEMQKQSDHSLNKIDSLEKAKADAEKEIASLRDTYLKSSKEVQQIRDSLKEKEQEIGDLAAKLFKEKETNRLNMEKSELIRERLSAQVQSLTNQLRVQVKKTQATRTMVELQVRAEYDGKIRRNFEMIAELEQKLSDARDDARVLYKENHFMATEFAKVGMRFESPQQFTELLKEFASAEVCANALAKALTESESELSLILKENASLKTKLDQLESENTTLRKENAKLSVKIEEMDRELTDMQIELDSHKARQKNYNKLIKKCKNATELYKAKVKKFQEDLANSDMVPIDVYKKAVDSSEQFRKSLKQKEEKIEQLTNRIHSLENIIKEKCIQKDHEEDEVTPKSEPPAQKVAQPRRMGRKAALLEKMKRNAQSAPKSGKKSTPKTKRSALGDHNANIEHARLPSVALASVCSM